METKDLELVVPALWRKSFELNRMAIHGFLVNGENVPAKLVKTLFMQIVLKENMKLRKYDIRAKEEISYVIDFMEKYPQYQLNWKFKTLTAVDETTYDVQKFAMLMIKSFYQYEDSLIVKRDKKKIIEFFYDAFIEDIEGDFEKLPEGKISNYTITVMSGLFAIAVGYKGKISKMYTPKEIYQFCRHPLGK